MYTYFQEEEVAAEAVDGVVEEVVEEVGGDDVPEVSLIRIMKANLKEWYLIVLGILGAAVVGSMYPVFAVIFGEILTVFARPADEILDAIHLWGGLFLVLGVVSGTAAFIKVRLFCFLLFIIFLTVFLFYCCR